MFTDLRVPLPVSGVRLSLWRAAVVFRGVALLVAIFLIVHWLPIYERPVVAALTGVSMLAVTVAIALLGWDGEAHRPVVVGFDLVVTVVLTLWTPLAQTAAQSHGEMVTLTTVWAAGPTLELAFLTGPVGGVVAAVIQYATTAGLAGTWSGRTLYSGTLLIVTGLVVGFVVHVAVRAEDDLRAVSAAQAALAERERLARSIHDGVLQVLGLVHRTGRDAGGTWGDLARAAGEQEAALRGLITSRPAPATPPGVRDLGEALRALRSQRVTVSTPAEPVALPATAAVELRDAVAAALDNVAVHAGPDAHAWVLLESLDGVVRVIVRDDGVGFADGRLAAAEQEGRLGVARSVRGRLADLGGHSAVSSGPGRGTEVELVLPLAAGVRR